MKSVIVCTSPHKGNTMKIARAMSDALRAGIEEPSAVSPGSLLDCGLVGFGSGIYMGKHHESLFSLIESLPSASNRKCFIFSTSGSGNPENHKKLRASLESKGFRIIDEFCCKGFSDWFFLKLFGGVNKGRPGMNDLENARKFARGLLNVKRQDL